MKHIIFIFSTCLVCHTAWAGWEVTYKDAESGKRSLEYYESGKANLGEIIFDGSRFLVVARDSRAYWEGTPQQYCDALSVQMKQMEAQIASVPAQYRPAPISKKKVTRKKVGTQSIAGFSATGYEFYVDGAPSGRVWVSSESGLSGIIDFERSMSKKMKCSEGMNKHSLEGAALYRKTVEGAFVLKESLRQIESVQKKGIPASYFGAPAGFKSFSDYGKFMNHISNRSRSSSQIHPSVSMPVRQPSTNENSDQGHRSDRSADRSSQPQGQEENRGIDEMKKGMKDMLKPFFRK